MAAPWNPPKRAEDFQIPISLADSSTPGRMKASPTIAAGDFKISKDFGAFANLATLPTVNPAGGVSVQISLTATEMTADTVMVACIDQTATPEWDDLILVLQTTA